jgi:hypothetical protein
MSIRRTRSEFLKVVGAGTAWVTLLSMLGCEPDRRTRRLAPAQPNGVMTFRSRPDLSPPTVEVATHAHDTAPGYVFVAPKKGVGQYGPMILDDSGQLVWFRPLRDKDEYAMDFKVQSYRGQPVLTWAEGRVVAGHGLDQYVVLDSSYREITRLQAGNGYVGDHHEFLITPQDTALLTIYASTPADLSLVGGSRGGEVLDGIAQEVDISTGEVLFEWHSLDHVGLDESYRKASKDSRWPFDYFHINSIDVDHDSNLLVSAKGTCTVYKINRSTGEVMWRLGGEKSDFNMGLGTRTAYQHDARRQPDGTITIFDNGADPKVHDQSRGIVVELDEDKMTATLVSEYTHPDRLLAGSQGNMQVLPNGNVFIGWGNQPIFSEFNSDGELVFDASFPPKDESYRAFSFQWNGQPSDRPAVAAEREPDDEVALYASWNGATEEVTTWQALAGPSSDRLKAVASVPRSGFETAITARTAEPYVAVQAKNRSGRVLGTTKVVRLRD